jgi:hypothetical protein
VVSGKRGPFLTSVVGRAEVRNLGQNENLGLFGKKGRRKRGGFSKKALASRAGLRQKWARASALSGLNRVVTAIRELHYGQGEASALSGLNRVVTP